MSGDFIMVNKHLAKHLKELGLWDKDMVNRIIEANGSVQGIEEIPREVREIYKTVWEIKQKAIIQLSIDRGPYICQTQILNLFFEEPDYNKLTSALFYGWRNGLKTGSYYIRSRPKVQAQQFTIDPTLMKQINREEKQNENRNENENNNENDNGNEKVGICSLDNREACEMCSS
jgi:ribonucleoside-diphosphate reductase alpha chain